MAPLTSFIVLSLLAVLGEVGGEGTISDYIHWKKEDIRTWQQYFPGRGLREEFMTNRQAAQLVVNTPYGLRESLDKVVQYANQEQETALMMMGGTNALECVKGISNFLENSIYRELSTFTDCIADVPPNLDRLFKSWSHTNDTYQSVYWSTLAGIDNCLRTYPNRESQGRLMSCVDTCSKTYFSRVISIYNAQNSPAMTLFSKTVVECAETAARQVQLDLWKYFNMLVQCSKLSDNVDTEAYEAEMYDGFKNYETDIDLMYQIFQCENMYNSYVSGIQQKMLNDYLMKRSALEKYIIESKNILHYTDYMRNVLQRYLDTLSSTASDFPGDSDCVSSAHSTLGAIISAGAQSALQCDKDIVNRTKYLISRVDNNFAEINLKLPHYGNVAILGCFSKGYVFAENTILKCYKLAFTGFGIDMTNTTKAIDEDIRVLNELKDSFFGSASLPCADSILSEVYWEADRVLYDLERCLYVNTGSKYSVTTYTPNTPDTTPATATPV